MQAGYRPVLQSMSDIRAGRQQSSQGQGEAVTGGDVDYGQVWHQTLASLGTAGVTAQERAFVRLCRLVGVLDQTAS